MITTHVLDVSRGLPAAGIRVALDVSSGDGWKSVSERRTDADGRVKDLWPAGRKPALGTYRLTFDTKGYFEGREVSGFYPEVAVVFEVRDARRHHVPLLLSPFGYSTYRGS